MSSSKGYFVDSKLNDLLLKSDVVIFDLNGLIIDDEGIQLEAVNMTLAKYSISIDEEYWINHCVGHRPIEFFRRILKENKKENPANIQSLVYAKNRNYIELIKLKLKDVIRPGIYEFVDFLHNDPDFRIAVCTSTAKEEVNIILGSEGLGIIDIFDYIITGDDRRIVKGKPDPQIYQLVAEYFNVHPSKCLVFEDATPGVESSFRAGMIPIAVPNKYTRNQDFKNAALVLSDLTSDAKILRINKKL
ncbi:MAG: HAD family phosphatase [Nanoarchaeota archaeon]|nr:HAD family phosphatase [Nanoarchaeota archaeon]